MFVFYYAVLYLFFFSTPAVVLGLLIWLAATPSVRDRPRTPGEQRVGWWLLSVLGILVGAALLVFLAVKYWTL